MDPSICENASCLLEAEESLFSAGRTSARTSTLSKKMESESQIQIFPNPSYGKFQINIVGESRKHLIVVQDLFEKVLMRCVANGLYELDLSAERSGVYVVKVINSKAERSFRIVKK